MSSRLLVLGDLLLIALCAYGAFVLRLDWFFADYRDGFVFYVTAALLIKPPVFWWFGLYRRYWQYASIPELQIVVLAVSAAAVVLAAVVVGGLWAGTVPAMPRSVLFIDWVLTLCCIGGARMSTRVAIEARTRETKVAATSPGTSRVLVVGAGDAGAMVVREMQRNPQLGKRPVGFLDDDPAKSGKRIHGIPVLGQLADLDQAMEQTSVDEVVIAMPSAPGVAVRPVVEACRSIQLPVRSMPGIYELLGDKVTVNRLRRVEITDLLRRAPVGQDGSAEDYLRGQVVLVTGAGGSIGSELCRQVCRAGAKSVVMLGHGENSIYETEDTLHLSFPGTSVVPVIADVRDRSRIASVFDEYRPAIVFHAAAHKHVPLMERNSVEAVTNNVIGTQNVVDAAANCGAARFVLISTDKAVLPSSIMGASKRIAELIVHDAAERLNRSFSVVRFGNVLGSRGSVVPRFKEQIERGGPVTITHPEMTRFFMTIPEAVHLVIQAGGISQRAELFVLKMGTPVRITDLADDLIRLSGFGTNEIAIAFTGLRPGEKLHEGLWEDGAIVEPTANPDVLKATETFRLAAAQLSSVIDRLRRAAEANDDLAVRNVFAEAIPTFAPPVEDPGRVRSSALA
jgi:FlaA1/EpsC-like NDP-sugar epimerase